MCSQRREAHGTDPIPIFTHNRKQQHQAWVSSRLDAWDPAIITLVLRN